MKFFIPHAKDKAHEEEIYEGAKKFAAENTGWKILVTKIFALRYKHDGREYFAQVGSLDYSEGLVVCILEAEPAYLVCTPHRGILSGKPVLVGREEVSDIEYFEEKPSS